ncbi:RHS repeat-associated core domain-containing protein [Prevotella melaninogenica]|uniref:RHS repeat-associated core domain-containing protein n=1 Tax=Prevotella melaninogenica TaxID=28132 RepID=UPI00241F17ED|nr:RHS repeat-associated core domain-containing protein [Prevotella melaninogenica]
MITTQLPDGTAVHHQHDQAGRLTYNKYTDGSWEAWEYDKAGRLTKAYNRDSVTEFVRNALGQVIKETQDGHSIMRKYDRAGHHVHTESSLGASIDYSHDKDGNLSEMNSGGWSARWQRDRVGLETERELTGGVHVKTHHDSLGRETYKSVGARNVEQFRRSYTWGIGNRLHATEDGLTGRRVRYDYDEFDNLLSAEYKQGNDVERIYRIPDRIGNLFETREKDDRKYGAGSRLTEDRDYFYHYDCEGNLVFKEFRTLDWAGVSVPLGVQKAHLEEELGITFRAFGAGWRYDWQSDGMLSRVVRPDSKEVSFAYDALGRRTEKTYEGVATHFVWDGNVPLHEWQEVSSDAEKTNITTWLFEQNTFIPAAKLAANGESFSIVSDYLGTPLQAFDNNGNKVWEQELDIFGRKRRKGNNNSSFIPFKYQGQYEDVETGLYYNRFRYYDSCIGNYISQDPIRLASNSVNLYSYISDSNSWLDIFGLFGSGKGTHTATINIYNSDGSLKPENPISIKSGDMTDAERSLGFPQSTLATHTEARAVKRYPLTDGERMEIIGQYPPCNSCRGKMRRATESGGIIDYKWINDKTGNQEWIRYEGNKKTIDSTSKNKKLHPKNIH